MGKYSVCEFSRLVSVFLTLLVLAPAVQGQGIDGEPVQYRVEIRAGVTVPITPGPPGQVGIPGRWEKDVITVPAGRTLVIEYVSMIAGSISPTEWVCFSLRTSLAENELEHALPCVLPTTFPSGTGKLEFAQGHAVKLYAKSGSRVIAQVFTVRSPYVPTSTTDGINTAVTIVGRLVPSTTR